MDLNERKQENQVHNLSHGPEIDLKELLGRDYSCQICYPLYTPEPENFEILWNWYRIQFEAYRYTGITIDLFIIINQTIPEFNSHPDDRDLFRILVAQISILVQSYRYRSIATELPLIAQLITVFIDTDCFSNNLSPFVVWTQASIKLNDYSLREELTVATSKKNITKRTKQTSDNPRPQLQTHQLRDGKSYTSSVPVQADKGKSGQSASGSTPKASGTEDNQSQPQLEIIEVTEESSPTSYSFHSESEDDQIAFNSPYNNSRTDQVIAEEEYNYPPIGDSLGYSDTEDSFSMISICLK